MKKIKNTGFRITIALRGDGGMEGKISTSTAHYIVENLLKRYETYNTSIKEMPGIIHSSDCNFHTATILLADFHSPDESSTSRLAEQLEELTGSDVFVQKYQVTSPSPHSQIGKCLRQMKGTRRQHAPWPAALPQG